MHTEIESYVKHWKRCLDLMEKARQSLFNKAINDAAKIAGYLREIYGCGDVYLIGSLLDKERFSEKSDIDFVVKGLPKDRYFYLLAEIRDITDFAIDIIPYEDANELIKNTEEQEEKRI